MKNLKKIYTRVCETQQQIEQILVNQNEDIFEAIRTIIHDKKSYNLDTCSVLRDNIIATFEGICFISSHEDNDTLFGVIEAVDSMILNDDFKDLSIFRGVINESLTTDAIEEIRAIITLGNKIFNIGVHEAEDEISRVSKEYKLPKRAGFNSIDRV